MAKITYEQVDHDAVAEGLHEGLEWTHRHRHLLIGLFCALMVALLVFAVVARHNRAQTQAVNALMGTALTAADQVENGVDEDARAASLKTLEEAVTTLNDQYAGQPLAVESVFLLGNAYYRIDDFAKAQDAYSRYLAQAKTSEQKARAEIALGYAAENESFLKTEQNSPAQTDKLNQALGHYESALTLTPQKDYVHYYALLSKARILELTSKNDEAIALYQQVLNERPAAIAAEEADEKEVNGLVAMFRDEIKKREGLLSFASTAQLRLDRLTAEENVASPALAGPEPAAEPTATPAS